MPDQTKQNPVACSFFSVGTRCAALLWSPAKSQPGKRTAGVVLCNGLRGVKEWFLPEIAEEFVLHDLAVLAFDYRGTGESDGERGWLVPNDHVEDVRNALSFLGSLDNVDSEGLFLFGTGTGGSHAIQAAAIDARVSAVAVQIPIGNTRRAWSRTFAKLSTLIVADRVNRVISGESATIGINELIDNPQSNSAFNKARAELGTTEQRIRLDAVERFFEYAPEEVAALLSPRGLLVVGVSDDEVVPTSESYSIYERANEPKDLRILKISHYQVFDSPHREYIVRLAVGWFRSANAGHEDWTTVK